VQIDFNVCFEKGLRLRVPEIVPLGVLNLSACVQVCVFESVIVVVIQGLHGLF